MLTVMNEGLWVLSYEYIYAVYLLDDVSSRIPCMMFMCTEYLNNGCVYVFKYVRIYLNTQKT